MKKTHPYYDLQELVNERWEKYRISEKDLIKWGADRKLQFCARLTPPAKHLFIEIECGYTEYVEDSSFRVPCEHKQINYGDHSKPYRLHPKTLDNLSNHVLDNKVKPVILTDCEWCEWKCELYKNRASGVYTSYEIFSCNTAKSSPKSPNYDIYWPTITKDNLLVCRSEVIRFGEILKRDYSAQTSSSINEERCNKQLDEFPPSTPDSIPQNNRARPSFNKEKIPDQDGSITLLFYKRKSDNQWIVGAEDNFGQYDNIEGFGMLHFLILHERDDQPAQTVEIKGATASDEKYILSKNSESFDEDYLKKIQKESNRYSSDTKDKLIKTKKEYEEECEKTEIKLWIKHKIHQKFFL